MATTNNLPQFLQRVDAVTKGLVEAVEEELATVAAEAYVELIERSFNHVISGHYIASHMIFLGTNPIFHPANMPDPDQVPPTGDAVLEAPDVGQAASVLAHEVRLDALSTGLLIFENGKYYGLFLELGSGGAVPAFIYDAVRTAVEKKFEGSQTRVMRLVRQRVPGRL